MIWRCILFFRPADLIKTLTYVLMDNFSSFLIYSLLLVLSVQMIELNSYLLSMRLVKSIKSKKQNNIQTFGEEFNLQFLAYSKAEIGNLVYCKVYKIYNIYHILSYFYHHEYIRGNRSTIKCLSFTSNT